jgi:solute carrier family 35 protein F1/2
MDQSSSVTAEDYLTPHPRQHMLNNSHQHQPAHNGSTSLDGVIELPPDATVATTSRDASVMSPVPLSAAPEHKWRKMAIRLAIGQSASLATASTGIFTTILVDKDASVPVLQSLFAYVFLACIFLPLHAWRRPDEHSLPGGRRRESDTGIVNAVKRFVKLCTPVHFPIWRYVMIALFDFGANTLAVWSYEFTDILSVQLLDCFTIPVVIVLAIFIFQRRPTKQQLCGAGAALLGMGLLVLFDYLHDSTTSAAPNPILGDMLCLTAAVCYAISNTACEALLKSAGPGEGGNVRTAGAAGAAAVDDSSASPTGASTSPALPAGRGSMRTSPPVPIVGGATVPISPLTAAAATGFKRADGGYRGLAVSGNTSEDDQEMETSRHEEDDVASSAWLSQRETAATRLDLGLEYLAFVPVFGMIYSTVAVLVVHKEIGQTLLKFRDPETLFAQLGFAAVMVVVYTAMPTLFAISSATFANLNLLSADVYAILLNLVCFGARPQPLFVFPFILIITGISVYEGLIDWECMKRRARCVFGGGTGAAGSPSISLSPQVARKGRHHALVAEEA